MLTTAQRATLAAHIKASTNPAVVTARGNGADIGRDDTTLAALYNAATTTNAWNRSVQKNTLFDATNITKFDNLSAGKRDAWRMLMDFAPVDATRNKVRRGVTDIWGDADAVSVLQDMRRKATLAETVLDDGVDVTENTVSAKKLDWEGTLTTEDVGRAMNENP